MVKESWKRKALTEASAAKAREALGSTEIGTCLGKSMEMEKREGNRLGRDTG